jgi:membrane glycosyltransferase
VTLPWTVVGFWNSSIGFLVGLFARDPLAVVLPIGERASMTDPITSSTAVVLCIRNETPTRLERNLEAMMQSLAATGFGQQLHVYVLSDTDHELIAQQEQQCFAAMTTRWTDRLALTYRRRTDNKGYKAGNIADFCARWGHLHDFVVTLDADSFMTGRAILRLVRIMQANPSLGILQGLVVGLPSTSGFTRLFQFGMRLGMRPYTMGSAWWQADCGPYWGHNAAIRIKPFIEHCELPRLPDHKGAPRHILSHDQVEAVLMRRAGYEVRVIPQEDESWEVTKKVKEYAEYMKKNPSSLKNLPSIIVVDGKIQDGAHRISSIYLLQNLLDPKNNFWKTLKLKVEFWNSKNLNESLHDWFKKEDWVRIDTAGNITGPCGTMKKGHKTTRCLPRAKANSLTKAERAATSKKKAASNKQFVPNTKKAKVRLKK